MQHKTQQRAESPRRIHTTSCTASAAHVHIRSKT